MPKLGLKVWSTNVFYIELAQELYKKDIFDYVELYVVPESAKDCLDRWKNLQVPFLVHAPHSYGGLNFSLSEGEFKNRALIEEVDSFKKALNSRKVIFHPGINGSLEETIRQIKIFKSEFPDLFSRVVIENKPKIGINGEQCVGSSPGEIKRILNETELGFCLDIGHAICYSAWCREDYKKIVDQFMALDPEVFHLSDGNMSSEKDMHLNFGKGNFKLQDIIQNIPSGAYVSIETKKESISDLNDFEQDVAYFKKYSNKARRAEFHGLARG